MCGLDRAFMRGNMTKTAKIAGAGIGLAAAGAMGAYLLSGERGAKNREMLSGWALKMRREILKKAEGIKEMNKEMYCRIVDETATRYARMERVGASELRHLTQELKGAWKHLAKQLR